MKIVLGVILVVAMISWTGCAIAPVMPPMGFIYTNTEAPLDYNVNQTEFGSKKGVASTHCILGMIAWGDGSMKAAADDGMIKTVRHADYDALNVLFIYSRYTTIAYGD